MTYKACFSRPPEQGGISTLIFYWEDAPDIDHVRRAFEVLPVESGFTYKYSGTARDLDYYGPG